MSGHGNREIYGLRFSLGSLVAFVWQPEGFWIFQSSNPHVPRSDRLINRFENNNYPDREGMEDELANDIRLEDNNRILTKDYKIKTWPPYERPVAPMFGMTVTDKNQDPKDKVGKFSGVKITSTLKLKKPESGALEANESVYPQEVKSDWFLHEPEHVVYLPKQDEFVESYLTRLIQYYILEYTNELRPNAPFLAPLRGEYSPAQWIAEFCQKAQELNHESTLYPENYVSIQDRAYKTRQFECSNGFDWWIGENLHYNPTIEVNVNDAIEDIAKIKARAVVDAWIDSPPHYANLIRWKDAQYKDLSMMDVGRIGDYYSQFFMGAPWWLQCGFCRWEGLESWQVLSWKTYENNRYGTPFEGRLYFKGAALYEHSELLGAAIYQSAGQYYLLVFVLSSKQIKALETPFNPQALKLFEYSDFTEVCQHTIIDGDYTKLQSFFASRDGEKGIGLVYWNKQGEDTKKYVVRYANRQFLASDAVLSAFSNYHTPIYNFYGSALIYSLEEYTAYSNTIAHVDYSDSEYLLTFEFNISRKEKWTSNYPNFGVPLITTSLVVSGRSTSYALNGSGLSGSTSSYYYSVYNGVTNETESGPKDIRFIDLRNSVYMIDNQLSVDGQTISLPFTYLYTRQKIDGIGYYPIFPNLINNYDYYYKNLLGCSYVRYDNEWIFSAVGYQIDYKISEEYELAIEVTASTPVKCFISSNAEITAKLNTLTKPFLVSRI